MEEHILVGTAVLTLVLAGPTRISQAFADDGIVSSLVVRAVDTTQGDSSVYPTAKCLRHAAKAVIKVSEWKTETINLRGQPFESEYMITSTRGQVPVSLTYSDYQGQFTNTTITADLTGAVGPQVTVTGNGVTRKAAPSGNIAVGVTGLAAGQELDVILYFKPYPLGKATTAADGSTWLNAVLSGDVILGSSHCTVIENDDKVGLANITIVNKDDLKKSGRPGGNGGKKNESGLPRTSAAI